MIDQLNREWLALCIEACVLAMGFGFLLGTALS